MATQDQLLNHKDRLEVLLAIGEEDEGAGTEDGAGVGGKDRVMSRTPTLLQAPRFLHHNRLHLSQKLLYQKYP
jgi:hypothetical protein